MSYGKSPRAVGGSGDWMVVGGGWGGGTLIFYCFIIEPVREISTLWYVRTAKPQISLRTRAV